MEAREAVAKPPASAPAPLAPSPVNQWQALASQRLGLPTRTSRYGSLVVQGSPADDDVRALADELGERIIVEKGPSGANSVTLPYAERLAANAARRQAYARLEQENLAAGGRTYDGFDNAGYDRDGRDRSGFTAAGYDTDGFDRGGRDRYGRDRSGFSRFGLDQAGYDSEGWKTVGRVQNPDAQWNREGANRATGTNWDSSGFSQDGVDASGYDRAGVDKNGYDREGWFASRRPWIEDVHRETGTAFGPDGFTRHGWDAAGFNREGYAGTGFNREGTQRNGAKYNAAGFDVKGVDRRGFHRSAPERFVANPDAFVQMLAEAEKGTSARQIGADEMAVFDREMAQAVAEHSLTKSDLKGAEVTFDPHYASFKGSKFSNSGAQASTVTLRHDGEGWNAVSVQRGQVPFWNSSRSLWEMALKDRTLSGK